MRAALFAIIFVSVAFGVTMSSRRVYSKNNFIRENRNISAGFVTYLELENVSSLKNLSYQNISHYDIRASSASLNMTLSLLLNGVEEGPTLNALQTFLSGNKTYLNEKHQNLLHSLNFKNVEFRIANAVYVQHEVNLTTDFLSICMNIYQCSISKIHFGNNINAAEIINSWVKETTNNEISNIISPSEIGKDAKIVLVNAIYFNNRWINTIHKSFIDETRNIMHKYHFSRTRNYYVSTIKFNKTIFHDEMLDWHMTCIEIPFLNKNVAMTIFLPNKEIELEDMEDVYFTKLHLLKNAYKTYLNSTRIKSFFQKKEVSLPKFTTDYTENLKYSLRESGLGIIFNNNTNFALISKIPLKVSNVIQKTSVRIIKERGIIISADTKEKLENTTTRLEKVIVDRPFFYTIEVNGVELFNSIVRMPTIFLIQKKDEL